MLLAIFLISRSIENNISHIVSQEAETMTSQVHSIYTILPASARNPRRFYTMRIPKSMTLQYFIMNL